MVEFIFKIVDSLFKVFLFRFRRLETGSANIFNSIAEVVVKVLVSDEIPHLNVSTGVVLRRGGDHFQSCVFCGSWNRGLRI